jgi:hypothetical protein
MALRPSYHYLNLIPFLQHFAVNIIEVLIDQFSIAVDILQSLFFYF